MNDRSLREVPRELVKGKMDERDSMSASGVVELDGKPSRGGRPKRQTLDVQPGESTQVVWRPQTKKKRSIVPLLAAAIVGVVVIGAAVALLLFNSTNKDPGQTTSDEDPLALYQVATELHEQGEHNAALQMLKRARVVTKHSRAHRQLDELEREIEASLNPTAGNQPGGKQPSQRKPDPKDAQQTAGQKNAKPSSTKTSKSGKSRSRSRSRTRVASRSRNVGMLYVESDAVGDVLVDGRPTGSRTPTNLSLTPGQHTVEVVPLIDPSLRMVRQVKVTKGQSSRLRLAIGAGGQKPRPRPTGTKGDTTEPGGPKGDATQPAIGTVGQAKPAIGTVGGSKPTIGIMKGK